MEKNSQTQFIENVSREGGFTSAKNVAGRETAESGSATGASSINGENKYDWIQHVPKVFATLEDRFPFTAALVGIIGYIVVASFGHLEDFGSYLRYAMFLIIVFVLYKFLYLQKIELRQAEKINKITLVSSIILIFIVIFAYFDKLLLAVRAFIR